MMSIQDTILYCLCKVKLEWDRRKGPIGYAQGYDLGSEGYADRRAAFSRQIFEQPFLLSIIREGQSVLDIGSGRGASATGLFEFPHDLKIVLTEPSLGELMRAPIRFSDTCRKFSGAINTGAESLPFKNETFDVVTLVDVFEHIVKWKESLREIHRVLRHGGYVYLQFPFVTNANHCHLGDLIRFQHIELFWKKETILNVYRRLAQEEVQRSDIERPEELAGWFEWHYEQHKQWLNCVLPDEFERELNSLGFSTVHAHFVPLPGYLPLLLRPLFLWWQLSTTLNVFLLQKRNGQRCDIGRLARNEARQTLMQSVKRKLNHASLATTKET